MQDRKLRAGSIDEDPLKANGYGLRSEGTGQGDRRVPDDIRPMRRHRPIPLGDRGCIDVASTARSKRNCFAADFSKSVIRIWEDCVKVARSYNDAFAFRFVLTCILGIP